MKEIGEMERSLRDAMLQADTAALADITVSDFAWTHSSGNVDSKLAWLERLRSASTKYTKLDTSEVEVRRYGNAAVVSGRLDMTFVSGAGLKDLPIRFLRVWVHDGSDWRLAAHTSTLLAK